LIDIIRDAVSIRITLRQNTTFRVHILGIRRSVLAEIEAIGNRVLILIHLGNSAAAQPRLCFRGVQRTFFHAIHNFVLVRVEGVIFARADVFAVGDAVTVGIRYVIFARAHVAGVPRAVKIVVILSSVLRHGAIIATVTHTVTIDIERVVGAGA
jgi:hypothetical protein